MAKSDHEMEEIKQMLTRVNEKISSAKVLNGGFDRLEDEIMEIKNLQYKSNLDYKVAKQNAERLEGKIDKLYDPEHGIYAKVQQTENAIETLSSKITNLAAIDTKLEGRLSGIEAKAEDASGKIYQITKITGEDHAELRRSIKLSKGAWWFLGFTATGLLSAIGKLLWDVFVG